PFADLRAGFRVAPKRIQPRTPPPARHLEPWTEPEGKAPIFGASPAAQSGKVPQELYERVKNPSFPAPVLVDVRHATVRVDVARLEDLYEEHGARLWRALFLYAGDR